MNEKITKLNEMKVVDWDVDGESLVYVFVEDNEKNRSLLSELGANQSDMEEMASAGSGFLNITSFAFDKCGADWYTPDEGFGTEHVETNKVSEPNNCDAIINALLENELHVLLLRNDESGMFRILAEKTSFTDRLGLVGSNKSITYHITYHLFPVAYNDKAALEKLSGKELNYLTTMRHNALKNIFERWTLKGYNKHHSKDMFNCKAFIEYTKQIGFTDADYM